MTTNPTTAPRMLTEREVATATGLARATLTSWRSRHRGPPFARIGAAVRYNADDLAQWIAARTVNPEKTA